MFAGRLLFCRQQHRDKIEVAFAQAWLDVIEYPFPVPATVEDLRCIENEMVISFIQEPLVANAQDSGRTSPFLSAYAWYCSRPADSLVRLTP